MKLTTYCQECNKPKKFHSEHSSITRKTLSQENYAIHEILTVYTTYKCGHTDYTERDLTLTAKKFSSLDNSKLAYDYQISGIEFIEEKNFNILLADEMGLGKTIQVILIIREHPELWPVVIVVKSAIMYQWLREFSSWCSSELMGICTLTSGTAPVIPGFCAYLISMDLLARQNKKTREFDIANKLTKLKPASIIVDECHSFKDPDSNRAIALKHLVQYGNIKHRMLLSGTPIWNRAGEFFTPLNLLLPDRFNSPTHFQREWLEQDEKNRYRRIKPWKLNQFRTLLSTVMIRREKKDVQKDLPELTQNNLWIEITDPILINSYNRELDLMENFFRNPANRKGMHILAWLTKMRLETGGAKVNTTLDLLEEFLESTDRKIAVGCEFTSVREKILYGVQARGYSSISFSGEDNKYQKDRAITTFQNDPYTRVLVANMRAGGEGLNLQFCSNCIVLDRAWSAARESQWHSRFHRNGQRNNVSVDTIIARGTIDEFMHNTIEEKKQICKETAEGWDLASDEDTLNRLLNDVLSHRL